MKPVKLVLVATLSINLNYGFPQRSSGISTYSLTLDDLSGTYSSILSPGHPVNCPDCDFNGPGELTIFSFTTNKENLFDLHTGSIPSGSYNLMLTADNYRKTFSFVKS